MNLIQRKARLEDLARIIELMVENDELGQSREVSASEVDERYVQAFRKIDADPNQYLMVVVHVNEIIGTCQLTFIPCLTFIGSARMQIESVRVAAQYRGKSIGSWMIEQAITYAKAQGASMIQLTTNKLRTQAKHFYEKLGFKATHEGMKLFI